MRPRRPPSPGSERRRSRRDTSAGPAGSIGTCTRRPSAVMTTATLRRFPESNQPNLVSTFVAAGLRRAGSLAGMGDASTATRWSRWADRWSGGHRPERLHQPVVAAAEVVEVDRRGRGRVGRAAEEIALPGTDPERPDNSQLRGRLDPFGDDEGTPAVGQIA